MGTGCLLIWYCARRFDIQGSHAQIAVVFQRQANQLLHGRVGKKLLPGQLIGRGAAGLVCRHP
jgi:hypothetical protein